MKWAGYFVMFLSVTVAVFGMAQFAWVNYTSPDPNPNPAGSGMLMTACWFLGFTLFGAGDWLAGMLRRPIV